MIVWPPIETLEQLAGPIDGAGPDAFRLFGR